MAPPGGRPPPKSGPNWLKIVGIGCGVLVLLAALCGPLYLLLSLGLLGVSRLSLVLAVALPCLRAWFDIAPVPSESIDRLRLPLRRRRLVLRRYRQRGTGKHEQENSTKAPETHLHVLSS